MTRDLVVKYLKIVASLLGLWLVRILWDKVSIPKAPEMTLPIIWGTLAGVLILFGFGLLFYILTRPKTEETEKSKDTPSETLKWVKEGAGLSLILITVGLIIFNLVSWAMIPRWWNVLFHTWYTLVFFNIAMGTILFLITLKQKGPDGKDTKEANPTASRLASLIGLLLALGIGTIIFEKVTKEADLFSSTQPIVLQPSFQPDLPAEIALPIIAECESGGKHFEEDGVTPLKNKEGSSAIGKYQILTSTHEERAKSMGFDIKTPEGYEAYAKVLYSEPDGIKHWLADSRAKECIEKGLKGNFDSEYGKRVWKMVVEAPTEGWTTWYPAKYFDLSIEGEDRIKSSYKTEFVTTEGVVVTEAPRDLQKKIPGITEKYRFKSLENKPVKIIVTLTPYKAK